MKLSHMLIGVGALYLLSRSASATGSSPTPSSPPAITDLVKPSASGGITTIVPLNEGNAYQYGVDLAKSGLVIPNGAPLIQVASLGVSQAVNAAYWATRATGGY